MGRLATVFAAISVLAAAMGGAFLVHTPTQTPAQNLTPATADDLTGYSDVHDVGVTGENVTVGIVDATGFQTANPQYAESVVAAQSFGDGKTITNGGRNNHGTAVAETIATVAPDSDLYLATFAEEADYRAAVEWLADHDVDVVVLPTSFFGKPGTGSGRTTRATAQLARDTVVVTASGNLGRSHWHGDYRPANGTMPVRDQNTDEPVTVTVSDDRVRLWLSWSALDERYRLRLMRNGTTVATSSPYPDDDVPNARIDGEVPNGTYTLAIDGPTTETATRLRLEALTGRLNGGRSQGSIVAPATARGVVVVGAFDTSMGAVAPYSSRGPTADGRNGVDVVGPATPVSSTVPDVSGTSYAAAYVAGVSALVLSVTPDASPATIEGTLERTAVDLGRPGWGSSSGYGLVQPGQAIAAIRGEDTGLNED